MWCHLNRFIQPCLSRASSSCPVRGTPVGTVSPFAWCLSSETFTSMSSMRSTLVELWKAIRELNSLWCSCEAGEDEPVPLGLILMRSLTCFWWHTDKRKVLRSRVCVTPSWLILSSLLLLCARSVEHISSSHVGDGDPVQLSNMSKSYLLTALEKERKKTIDAVCMLEVSRFSLYLCSSQWVCERAGTYPYTPQWPCHRRRFESPCRYISCLEKDSCSIRSDPDEPADL